MLVEIGGTAKGAEYDALDAAGTASLDGTLEVALLNGFVPSLGAAFEILAATAVDHSFVSALFPDLGPTLAWDLLYDVDRVTLAVVPALAGDYNGNGVVDAAAYTVWRDTFGRSGAGLAADGTGADGRPDGVVDELDYDFWKAHFGESAGNGAAANAAVPEPGTLVLLAAAVVALAMRRWK